MRKCPVISAPASLLTGDYDSTRPQTDHLGIGRTGASVSKSDQVTLWTSSLHEFIRSAGVAMNVGEHVTRRRERRGPFKRAFCAAHVERSSGLREHAAPARLAQVPRRASYESSQRSTRS